MNLPHKNVMYRLRLLLNYLIVMKLTFVLLTMVFLQSVYAVNAQNINISKDKASIHSILKEIRVQTGYDFFFEENMLKTLIFVGVLTSDLKHNTVPQQYIPNS